MAKVKSELDENLDESQLKKEAEPSNADVEQLEEIERKEDEELEKMKGEDLQYVSRKSAVHGGWIEVKEFTYDKENHLWCRIQFELPVKFKSIDMTNVMRDAAKASIIWQVPKIKRAFTHKQNDVLVVTTDGINIGVGLRIIRFCAKLICFPFTGHV